jgi:hypothetical protein
MSGSRSVCYIVSHGFAARMIMQTDLLSVLSKKGLKVSLISPDANDPVLVEYCKEHSIDLYSFRSKKWIWKSNYVLYRTYFLEDIKANPALYEKHYYETHIAKHKFFLLRFIPYLLICFYYLIKIFPGLKKISKKIENGFLNSSKATTLLETIRPDLLISTYPVNPQEGILLYNANKAKIKTAIHLLSWDNITSKGHFYAMADYYIAWGPVMKQEFIEKYNIAEDRIFITGVPHFDIHVKNSRSNNNADVLLDFGLDPVKPFLVFGMSSPRFAPKEIDIVEYLAIKLNENEFGTEMQMIIRPHPQNVKGHMADESWMVRLNALRNERIKLFIPDLAASNLPWSMERYDMVSLSKLLSACVVCINSCSTLSIDTLMAGKGNIAPMFDGNTTLPYRASAKRLLNYTHIKKFISYGGSRVVDNYENMLSEIKKFQLDSDYKLEDRNHAKEMECGIADGRATDEVVNVVVGIMTADR